TERVIDVEELGADGFTDILTVSFSSNDLVGHRYGPDSPQVRDVTLRTDLLLDKLLKFVDKEVGLSETAIVLTSDHGICPMPEAILPLRMDAGRIPKEQVIERVNTALAKRFGVQGKWVDGKGVRSLYLNQALIREAKITEAQAEAAAAETLRSMKHIYRVYTKSDLARNRVGNDPIDQRVRNGFYAPRAANLFVIADPYYTFGSNGIDHGSPFTYDTNVPVIFLGRWFKAGLYTTPIRVNDIAPTLSAILELPAPSGNVGRPLTEIFVSMN
ncbi:MAG TPA: alkaline phosphatase family protein, partial [Bryobacteraceae bacterium]|nr:alkaline phosphatase family protein [Bryobacteraceae bacterium]